MEQFTTDWRLSAENIQLVMNENQTVFCDLLCVIDLNNDRQLWPVVNGIIISVE